MSSSGTSGSSGSAQVPSLAQLADAVNGLLARMSALEGKLATDLDNVVRSGRELQAEFQAMQQAVAGLRAQGGGGKQRFKVPAPRKFSDADGTRSLMPWLTSRVCGVLRGNSVRHSLRGVVGGPCS